MGRRNFPADKNEDTHNFPARNGREWSAINFRSSFLDNLSRFIQSHRQAAWFLRMMGVPKFF